MLIYLWKDWHTDPLLQEHNDNVTPLLNFVLLFVLLNLFEVLGSFF